MRRVLAAVAVVLAACGGSAADPATGDGVHVEDAWARVTVPAQTVGAVYFEIESDAGDTLTSVSVPRSVARAVEMHESVADHTGDSTADSAGMAQMSMRRIDAVPLPSGQSVSFQPGGYHVMLVDLAQTLIDGESFEMTLEFEHAEPLTVDVAIAESQP
jgi:copper(I)-binding protein